MKREPVEVANLSVFKVVVTQTLLMEKHPVETFTPAAKVVVAEPVTAKDVVVAWDEVELTAVKFWRVVEPTT